VAKGTETMKKETKKKCKNKEYKSKSTIELVSDYHFCSIFALRKKNENKELS